MKIHKSTFVLILSAISLLTVQRASANWTGFSIYSFDENDWPSGGLVLNGSTLYGVTQDGGANANGSIYSISTNGDNYTVLYSVPNDPGSDANNPVGGLTLGSSGDTLYGTESANGTGGYGSVFSIGTDGSSYTTLHSFSNEGGTPANDGATPSAGLILSDGVLYGTTSGGGTGNHGAIFDINTDGSGYTTLHSFSGSTDGSLPQGRLFLTNGVLFGTATQGGANSGGTVYSVTTSGGSFTVLHSFSYSTDGIYPVGSVVLWGTNLFGTSSWGGPNATGPVPGCGTVWELDTNGVKFTVIHPFGGSGDPGFVPIGDLFVYGGEGGELVGVTLGYLSYGYGSAFQMATNGANYQTIWDPEGTGIATNISGGKGPVGLLFTGTGTSRVAWVTSAGSPAGGNGVIGSIFGIQGD